jgi:DnaJ-class molecular chaperone
VAGDPYQELGIKRDVSAEELQKAFRKLAKELHPDRNPGNAVAEERFKRASAAFDFLKDADKRQRYDRGEIDADGKDIYRGGFNGAATSGYPGRSSGGAPFGASARFDGVDLDEIFDMFGGGRPKSGPSRPAHVKGADVKISLDIDLMDTLVGNTRRILLSDGRTLDVNIPKGSRDGQTLRLKQQGSASSTGGPSGDALIELKLKSHPIFELDGNDLYMDLAISVPQAILGGKVEAPTPDGPVSVTIAPASNSGAILRLKGRGAYEAKTGLRGDLFARLMIALPEKIDDRLKNLATDWQKTAAYKPLPLHLRRKT